MNEIKVKNILSNYNKLRDNLIAEYNLRMEDKRGNIEKNLNEVLAIEVWFIEEQEKLDNEFVTSLKEIANND